MESPSARRRSRGDAAFLAFVALVAVAGILTALLGCSAEYWAGAYPPETKITLSKGLGGAAASIRNTKDVDVELIGFTFDPGTNEIRIESLKFRDDASGVLGAQGDRAQAMVALMNVQVDYQRVLGDNIRAAGDAFGAAGASILSAGLGPTGLTGLGTAVLGGDGLTGVVHGQPPPTETDPVPIEDAVEEVPDPGGPEDVD